MFGVATCTVPPNHGIRSNDVLFEQDFGPNRMPFLAVDRVVLGWACHLFPKARGALAIAARDRNRSTTKPKISLNKSDIPSRIVRFPADCQPDQIYDRDRLTRLTRYGCPCRKFHPVGVRRRSRMRTENNINRCADPLNQRHLLRCQWLCTGATCSGTNARFSACERAST